MEPRADDGDDLPQRHQHGVSLTVAAMEPRADDGDDDELSEGLRDLVAPQWSPVLMTGTTPSTNSPTNCSSCRNGAPC